MPRMAWVTHTPRISDNGALARFAQIPLPIRKIAIVATIKRTLYLIDLLRFRLPPPLPRRRSKEQRSGAGLLNAAL